jgi:hypothetical protein
MRPIAINNVNVDGLSRPVVTDSSVSRVDLKSKKVKKAL